MENAMFGFFKEEEELPCKDEEKRVARVKQETTFEDDLHNHVFLEVNVKEEVADDGDVEENPLDFANVEDDTKSKNLNEGEDQAFKAEKINLKDVNSNKRGQDSEYEKPPAKRRQAMPTVKDNSVNTNKTLVSTVVAVNTGLENQRTTVQRTSNNCSDKSDPPLGAKETDETSTSLCCPTKNTTSFSLANTSSSILRKALLQPSLNKASTPYSTVALVDLARPSAEEKASASTAIRETSPLQNNSNKVLTILTKPYLLQKKPSTLKTVSTPPLLQNTSSTSTPKTASTPPLLPKTASTSTSKTVSTPPPLQNIASTPTSKTVSMPPPLQNIASISTSKTVSTPPPLQNIASVPTSKTISTLLPLENIASVSTSKTVSTPPPLQNIAAISTSKIVPTPPPLRDISFNSDSTTKTVSTPLSSQGTTLGPSSDHVKGNSDAVFIKVESELAVCSSQNNVFLTETSLACNQCNEMFFDEETLNSHLLTHAGENPFICNVCSERFFDRVTLKKHLERHGITELACAECPLVFSSKKEFTKHQRLHNGEKPFLCLRCDKRFSRSEELIGHLQFHDQEKPFKCDFCAERFSLSRQLKSHRCKDDVVNSDTSKNCSESSAQSEVSWTCNRCNIIFLNLEEYKNHESVHETVVKYICETCNESFSYKAEFSRHKITHFRAKYVCDRCDQSFSDKADLSRHRRTHDGEKPLTCEECGKKFSRKYEMNVHIRTAHKPQTPETFICPGCNAPFTQKRLLNKHLTLYDCKGFECDECDSVLGCAFSMKLHKEQHKLSETSSSFQCLECTNGFSSKEELEQHVLIHSDKPFSCFECDSRFESALSLTLHLQQHKLSETSPSFHCSQCTSAFLTKEELEQHVLLHKRDEPLSSSECDSVVSMQHDKKKHKRSKTSPSFHCLQCTRAFSTKKKLEQHVLVHESVDPFLCSKCNQRFKEKDDLIVHEQNHFKPYICTECHKRFALYSSLSAHVQEHIVKKSNN